MYQITYVMMSDSLFIFTQLAFLYQKIYRNNFLKIMRDEHHQPHSYIPKRLRLYFDTWFYQTWINFCYWF